MFYRLFAAACIILSLSVTAWGGSIFDDDGVGVPPPTKAPAPSSGKHQPQPPSRPEPPAQPELPDQTPARPPTPARVDPDPAPADPVPAHVDPIPATPPNAADKTPQADPDKLRSDLDEAKRKAEEQADAALAKDAEYVKIKSDQAAAKARLKDPYLSQDEKTDLLNASLAATTKERRLREKALASCPAAKDVKRLSELVAVASPILSPVTSDKPADRPPEIVDAIARHDLIAGMTYREACRAARRPSQLVNQAGDQKIYRWIVKGRTGTTHTEVEGGRRKTYRVVADFGVVGYVQGTFVNDSLTEFSRVSLIGDKPLPQ